MDCRHLNTPTHKLPGGQIVRICLNCLKILNTDGTVFNGLPSPPVNIRGKVTMIDPITGEPAPKLDVILELRNVGSRWQRQWLVPGSGKMPYAVSLAQDGHWECACISWTRKTPREDCKHILKVKLEQALPGVKPVTKSAVKSGGRRFR